MRDECDLLLFRLDLSALSRFFSLCLLSRNRLRSSLSSLRLGSLGGGVACDLLRDFRGDWDFDQERRLCRDRLRDRDHSEEEERERRRVEANFLDLPCVCDFVRDLECVRPAINFINICM